MYVCFHRPDVVVYNAELKAVSLVELFCPFNSHSDLSAVNKASQNTYKMFVSLIACIGLRKSVLHHRDWLPWPKYYGDCYIKSFIILLQQLLDQVLF